MTKTEDIVALFVPGQPIPKARARVTDTGTYTPRTTVEWENEIRQAARECMHGRKPFSGSLEVELSFFGARKNADIENCSKAVCDAMNRVVYDDDKQIDHLHLHRMAKYSRKGVYIRVIELHEGE